MLRNQCWEQASQVLPISARKALQAKIAVAGGQSAGFFAGLWGDRGELLLCRQEVDSLFCFRLAEQTWAFWCTWCEY